jgi:hypothetical protein
MPRGAVVCCARVTHGTGGAHAFEALRGVALGRELRVVRVVQCIACVLCASKVRGARVFAQVDECVAQVLCHVRGRGGAARALETTVVALSNCCQLILGTCASVCANALARARVSVQTSCESACGQWQARAMRAVRAHCPTVVGSWEMVNSDLLVDSNG